jgi:acetoin utilization deacetylase AcuC-like enzyme
MADVLRVHEWSYVRSTQYLCEELSDDELGHLDGDTVISRLSFEAAMYAAGKQPVIL